METVVYRWPRRKALVILGANSGARALTPHWWLRMGSMPKFLGS